MVKSKTSFDFVFIGSGMSSLCAAVILAKEGYRVLILEKNQQLGGSLQTFSRDKRIFDTGVHYIGSLNEKETLHQIFKYLGILPHIELMKLNEECFDEIHFPNDRKYSIGQGYDKFIEVLLKDFPKEEAAIIQFCKKVKEACDAFPLYSLKPTNEFSYLNNAEVMGLDAWEYLNSITKNSNLIGALLGSGPLYVGEKRVTPFYVVALILNSYITGAYRVKDGGGQLTKALVQELRKFDVDILKRKEVCAAHYTTEGLISTVECTDGTQYQGRHFVSNIHPSVTIDLFGEKRFNKAYVSRVRKIVNTSSCFSLYISLKEGRVPYKNYNIYDYNVEPEDVWSIVDYKKDGWPQVVFISMQASKKQNEFADGISVITYMNYEEVSKWSETFNTAARKGNRGEDYEKFKKEKEELIIRRLESHFPDLREQKIGVYSSSPLTYKDYIGNKDGSLYGIKKDVNKSNSTIIGSKTKVKNLYLTGQNLVFHGILGASIGAVLTCSNFIDNNVLLNKIKDA